ncbi:SoxR reducing system RseC family protein [Thiomicrorhabdus arctica]|uniref:SoxR reducing system RseC family protein n=1 Tax=Thiomicrorhabdus arctica TaxID=131540 RepID=UPI0003AAAF95|nr:SoxR reducing system RseC family protein [Thiomicrorhabdus arctica]
MLKVLCDGKRVLWTIILVSVEKEWCKKMNKHVNESHQQTESVSESRPLDLGGDAELDVFPMGESHLLRESGIISSIEGEFAYVDAQRQSGCSGCASSSSCGTSALATLFTNTSQSAIKVRNRLNAQVGDHVILTLDESRLIKHSFMAYGVPLIGLFLFSVLFSVLSVRVFDVSDTVADVAAMIGGFLGVALGWWLTHTIYQPVLPEISLPNT